MLPWQHSRAWKRVGLLFTTIISVALFHAIAHADTSTSTIVVKVFQAQIVKIPAGAQTLVIGNPLVADVTMQSGVMIVTGKGYGETNFIALDKAGNPVAESVIRVVAAENNLVVQRGMDRQSYSCAPRCQPTIQLGDDTKYFGETNGQFQTIGASAINK